MSGLPPGPFVNLAATATVLSPRAERVAAFDRAGRLLTYARGEELYRRSLASHLYVRKRSAETRWLRVEDGEAVELFAEVRELALGLGAQGVGGELGERIGREIAPWSPARLLAERERFSRTYRPIAILPPDQYLSAVVQVTEGCTWNRCTFCSFYQDRAFRVRSGDELDAHVEAVRELLGGDLARRRSVFLADGNALALATERIRPVFELVARAFPGLPVASFVDLWSGEKREGGEWQELAKRGLAQVSIGMETGDDELLALVNKPGTRRELEGFVSELKRAGLALSLIVIVGLGGERYRARHREATLASLAAMPLDRRDLVYLSPLVEDPASEYAGRARSLGLAELTAEEVEKEIADLAKTLRAGGLRVGRYDIREFLY